MFSSCIISCGTPPRVWGNLLYFESDLLATWIAFALFLGYNLSYTVQLSKSILNIESDGLHFHVAHGPESYRILLFIWHVDCAVTGLVSNQKSVCWIFDMDKNQWLYGP